MDRVAQFSGISPLASRRQGIERKDGGAKAAEIARKESKTEKKGSKAGEKRQQAEREEPQSERKEKENAGENIYHTDNDHRGLSGAS